MFFLAKLEEVRLDSAQKKTKCLDRNLKNDVELLNLYLKKLSARTYLIFSIITLRIFLTFL